MKTLCRYFLYATISFTLPSCAGTASDCAKKTSCCKSQEQKVACNKDGKKACNKDSAKACNKK